MRLEPCSPREWRLRPPVGEPGSSEAGFFIPRLEGNAQRAVRCARALSFRPAGWWEAWPFG